MIGLITFMQFFRVLVSIKLLKKQEIDFFIFILVMRNYFQRSKQNHILKKTKQLASPQNNQTNTSATKLQKQFLEAVSPNHDCEKIENHMLFYKKQGDKKQLKASVIRTSYSLPLKNQRGNYHSQNLHIDNSKMYWHQKSNKNQIKTQNQEFNLQKSKKNIINLIEPEIKIKKSNKIIHSLIADYNQNPEKNLSVDETIKSDLKKLIIDKNDSQIINALNKFIDYKNPIDRQKHINKIQRKNIYQILKNKKQMLQKIKSRKINMVIPKNISLDSIANNPIILFQNDQKNIRLHQTQNINLNKAQFIKTSYQKNQENSLWKKEFKSDHSELKLKKEDINGDSNCFGEVVIQIKTISNLNLIKKNNFQLSSNLLLENLPKINFEKCLKIKQNKKNKIRQQKKEIDFRQPTPWKINQQKQKQIQFFTTL